MTSVHLFEDSKNCSRQQTGLQISGASAIRVARIALSALRVGTAAKHSGRSTPLISHPPSLIHSSLVRQPSYAVIDIPFVVTVLPIRRMSGDPDNKLSRASLFPTHRDIRPLLFGRHRTARSGTSDNERMSAAVTFIVEVRTAQGRRTPSKWTGLYYQSVRVYLHATHPHLDLTTMDAYRFPTGLYSSQV